ncbi:MAG: Fe-S cluster assembly protein SufD, partial [Flavobacteriales bacterium]|nr:Fe-S cluster assembly protein SufD [Flavobacteriales bacterium]
PENVTSVAATALEEIDAPTRRTEAWKYTRVNKILKGDWKQGESIEVPSDEHDEWKGHHVRLVNGIWTESDIPSGQDSGIVCESIAIAKEKHPELFKKAGTLSAHGEDLFEAMNTLYAKDGVFIYVPKNVTGADSILLEWLTTNNNSSMPRTLILLEEGAELNLAWLHKGQKASFQNALTEAFVAENAKLTVDFIQDTQEQFDLNNWWVAQERNSTFTILTATKSADWARNNINVRVNGEGCTTNLYGTYKPRAKQHVDNHTMIDHRVPHCESNEMYKGILYDQSTGVFNGKVFVRQDAQKTNAFQQNANILMSEKATMNSKPELEIYADDVKCSHGSTTGQFDEEAVFYLMARGIKEENARELLVEAFIVEVLENVHHPEMLDYFRK